MAMNQYKRVQDITEAEIHDWRIPPVKVIIRRNLKGSLKKRISRPAKQQLSENHEESKEPDFPEPSEKISHSFEDLPDTVAAGGISVLSAKRSRLSSEEEHNDRCSTIPKQYDDSMTYHSRHSELSQTGAHGSANEGISRPTTRRLSLSFISDLRLPTTSEERPTTSQRLISPETRCQLSDVQQQRPQSCMSSVSSSSGSSIEQNWLERTQTAAVLKQDLPPEDDSDKYDTDCELEITSEFRELELKDRQMQQDSDIGHITYQKTCKANSLLPRMRVQRQLWQKKLDLRHAGLLTAEVKAVMVALSYNNRIEEADLSHNSMTSEAVTYVVNTLLYNTYVTKLSVAGSTVEINGAIACGTLLSINKYLTSLDISECSIGDNEVGYIAQGIQERGIWKVNQVLQRVNLSKNKIGLMGSLQLARAFGENTTLTSVDLSWNHIRGAGAVALGNSLKKNKKLEQFDISWNGLGFEGSVAFGETLRVNKTLKRLNLENNRINLDSALYLARGIALNHSLEILQMGHNPISIQGCEEILKALAKPTSRIKFLSFKEIPINTKIALKVSDIAKYRDFTLQHGGILNTKDVTGIQRPRREDPFSLLIRYLSIMGIRVVDLFRMFDKNNDLYVTKEKFIQGLKRVRVPLDDKDLQVVAKRLRSNKRGEISYKELASTVRNRILDKREEYRRQEILHMKKRNEELRILQLDKPLYEASYISSIHSLYGPGKRDIALHFSPISGTFGNKDSGFTPLPPIRSGKGFNVTAVSSGRTISNNSVSKDESGRRYVHRSDTGGKMSGSPYFSPTGMQNMYNNLARRQRFL